MGEPARFPVCLTPLDGDAARAAHEDVTPGGVMNRKGHPN
jgi:hypothetical protein